MPVLNRSFVEPAAHMVFWSAVTIGLYILARGIYGRWPRSWLMLLAVAPVLIAAVVLAAHARYDDYVGGTHWLALLLGPATVAFAVPICERRALIREQWLMLLVGMVASSATVVLYSRALSTLVGLDGELRLSLLPRSIRTLFAMEVLGEIGGSPELTAHFVVVTGIAGAGTARAQQLGEAEGGGRGPGHGTGRSAERAGRDLHGQSGEVGARDQRREATWHRQF